MYVYNITFVADQSEAEEVLAMIRRDIVPPLSSGPADLRLSVVEEAGGVSAEDMAASISLQADFQFKEDMRRWEGGALRHVLASYAEARGEKGITFSTILRSLPLK